VAQKPNFLVRGVEVLVHGRLVPLIPTRPNLSSVNTGWEGIALETHSTPPCDHPDHEHPYHFLQIQTGAPARFEWTTSGGTRSGTADPGTIFLCPRGSRDRVRWETPTSRIDIALHPLLLTQALDETAHLADIELTRHFDLHDRHIASLMVALRSDVEDGSPAGRLYGESLATALSVYLQKRYAVLPPRTFEYRGGMPKVRLNRVLEYIRANIGEDIKLGALAESAGMSAHYFSELFKQSTGLSPHHYVLRQRVGLAKEHLRNPKVSIIEASVLAGFSDQSHFTKVFHRVVGVTPKEFRAHLFGCAPRTSLHQQESTPNVRVDETEV
jgi:AraC family transcriptional regulator